MSNKIAKQVLIKRAVSRLEHKNYDYECMSYSDVSCYMPKHQDIPNIVESILFWQDLVIPTPKSRVEFQQNKIASKNAKVLLNMLEKHPKFKKVSQGYFYNKMKKDIL
jgi:hypothetical protein